MQSIRKLLCAGIAATLLGSIAPAAAAPIPSLQLAQAGACNVTLTGMITNVIGPGEFSMTPDNRRVGNIHIYDGNATITTRGNRVATGNYAAVLGCFNSDGRSFTANRVTIAPSQSAYRRDNVASAPAYQVGPCHVSLFGYITQVWPNGIEFTLQTTGGYGSLHVFDRGALMHTNGMNIANGVYAGVYGCFINNERFFHANEVSLAGSPQAYYAYFHPQIAVSGIVYTVGRGWIGVRTRYYGSVHVVTNQSGVHNGQRVTIQGVYDPRTRQIEASSISVI